MCRPSWSAFVCLCRSMRQIKVKQAAQQDSEPLTPSYEKVPMPQRTDVPCQTRQVETPSADPTPEPCTSNLEVNTPEPRLAQSAKGTPKQNPAKRKPQRKPQLTGPLTEVEALRHEVSRLRSKKDLTVLDLRLRIGTLRTFLQEHDLWEPFLAKNVWW